MSSFLNLSIEERRIYCIQAAEQVNLPPAFIEKDFWVCWTLEQLQAIPELTGKITFKGGTSLSKAWNLIHRFSEDIDLAVHRDLFGQNPPMGAENAPSNRQRKLRLIELENKNRDLITNIVYPKLHERISSILKESFELTIQIKGREINLQFAYPGAFKNELGAVLPVVLIELVPRADDIPNEEKTISPIIHDVFEEILNHYSIRVPTLLPERTFLEKLMLIHETISGHSPGQERKSRHFYDLYCMFEGGVFEKIKLNPSLFKEVLQHRKTFFKYAAMNYEDIFIHGIEIVPNSENLVSWRTDYSRTTVMIYRNVPSFEELMSFAFEFQEMFNHWVKDNACGASDKD